MAFSILVWRPSWGEPHVSGPRCIADPACPYPEIIDGCCRNHYYDRFAVASWTRLRTGHSWLRNWTKPFTVEDIKLIEAADRSMRQHMTMLGRKGADHPNTKLANQDVVKIRYLIAAGQNRVKLADEFGVSTALISAIASGNQRSDLGGPITRFTHEDRRGRSQKSIAEKWRRYREAHGEERQQRNERVKEMREQGMTWRQIEEVVGIKYPTLLTQYHEFYGVPKMDHRQAGLRRKRLSGGNQFQVNQLAIAKSADLETSSSASD